MHWNAQTEKWIRRRQKTSLNVRNSPRLNPWVGGESWGEWIFIEAHRLDKYTYSCGCNACGDEHSFSTYRTKMYREMDEHEARKW